MSLRREMFKRSATPMTNPLESDPNVVKNENPHWIRTWYDPPMFSGNHNEESNGSADIVMSDASSLHTIGNSPQPNMDDKSSDKLSDKSSQLQGVQIKTWVISDAVQSDSADCDDENTDCIIPLDNYQYPAVLFKENKHGDSGNADSGKDNEISVSELKDAVGGGDEIKFSNS